MLTSYRATIFFIHVLNRRALKSFRAASQFTWPFLHKYSPPLHLEDLNNPVKSLEGEQSAVLAFYDGAQYQTLGSRGNKDLTFLKKPNAAGMKKAKLHYPRFITTG